MRRSAEEALTLADHAEAVGASFARGALPCASVVLAIGGWIRVVAPGGVWTGVLWAVPLVALAIAAIFPLMMPAVLWLWVRRPGAADANDIVRVCYAVALGKGSGSLWIGRRSLHLHFGSASSTLNWSTIREIRVESPGAFATIFGTGPRGYPLVIVREGEPDLRLFVLAPVSVARSMRRAMANEHGRLRPRSGVPR